jgi:hypothetical protein
VRSSTRSKVVRDLADQATVFVMHHMQMLESTGLVQYGKLPPAAMPPAQDLSQLGIATANAALAPPLSPVVLWLLAAGAALIAALAAVRIVRSRRPTLEVRPGGLRS